MEDVDGGLWVEFDGVLQAPTSAVIDGRQAINAVEETLGPHIGGVHWAAFLTLSTSLWV